MNTRGLNARIDRLQASIPTPKRIEACILLPVNGRGPVELDPAPKYPRARRCSPRSATIEYRPEDGQPAAAEIARLIARLA